MCVSKMTTCVGILESVSVCLSLWSAGTKVNGRWKTMNYRSYYENVRLAAKGFIKVTVYC